MCRGLRQFILVLLVIAALPAATSMWTAETLADGSLYADQVARKRGDLITILVKETVTITDKQTTETKRKSDPIKASITMVPGTNQLPASLARLQALTSDNSSQQARLDSLRMLVEQEFRILRPLTEIQKSMGQSAMQTLLDTDRQTLRQVRILYNRTKESEMALLAQRSALQDVFEKATPIVVLISAVLAVLITVWLVMKIMQELADNRRLQGELADINAEISRRISQIQQLAEQVVLGDYTVKIPDTAEDNIGGLATSLNRMTKTLDASFSALEKRNQELDQFAYVASHDLKAPLRGVTTIVKWIEDELAAELSPQLHTYLDQMKGRLSRLEDLIKDRKSVV